MYNGLAADLPVTGSWPVVLRSRCEEVGVTDLSRTKRYRTRGSIRPSAQSETL